MLQSILADAAARYGDKTALVTASRTLSYRELDDLSSAFAGALRGRGIDDGDRVSIYSQNRWEWVVAYHGIVKAGAVVNPINVMLTAEEVAFVLNDCGAAPSSRRATRRRRSSASARRPPVSRPWSASTTH